MSKYCPICGGGNVRYIGCDDGGGDYGTAIVDLYNCEDCDLQFEVNPVEYGDLEDEEDEP